LKLVKTSGGAHRFRAVSRTLCRFCAAKSSILQENTANGTPKIHRLITFWHFDAPRFV
jgi:hypothetical protein